MDEALEQAVNMPVESGIAEETAPVESAPTETNAQVEVEGSEKTAENTETTQEKMVPLSALQKERAEKKSLRDYIKSLQTAPVPQEEYAPQQGYDQPYSQEQEVEYVDPNQFLTRDEFERMTKESQSWAEAERDFPELKELPQIKKMAEGLRRVSALEDFRYLSPYDAVKEALAPYKMAQAKGQRSAQESIEIQKQARVEGSGIRVDDKAERLNQLKGNLSKRGSASRDALTEILKEF